MANETWQNQLNQTNPSRLSDSANAIQLGDALAAVLDDSGFNEETPTPSSSVSELANGKINSQGAVLSLPKVVAVAGSVTGQLTPIISGTVATGQVKLTESVAKGGYDTFTTYASDAVSAIHIRYVPKGGKLDKAVQALAATAA